MPDCCRTLHKGAASPRNWGAEPSGQYVAEAALWLKKGYEAEVFVTITPGMTIPAEPVLWFGDSWSRSL